MKNAIKQLLIVIFLGSCESSFAQDTKVLFIGNSFTGANNMPGIFEELTKEAGMNVKVHSHAPGGVYVGDVRPGSLSHAYDPQVYALIRSDKWDYVVVQDNQGFYSYDVGVFPPYSKVIEGHQMLRDSAVDNNHCAKMVLFSGWCFKNGWPGEFANGSEMNQRVYENYNFINQTLNEIVSPISISWNRIIAALPATDLWDADEAHPSYAGSYLTAATIYASVFRSSPEKVMYKGALDSAIARLMRKTAYETVIDSITPTFLSKHTIALSSTGTQLTASTGYKKYDWYKGNVLAGSTTTNTYGPVVKGDCYQLIATATNDCQVRSAVHCHSTTGISEITENAVSIYPNPATDILNVELKNTVANVKVQLYTMTGSLVYSKIFESNGSSVYRNQLPPLASGIYLVKVFAGDRMHTARVTVANGE